MPALKKVKHAAMVRRKHVNPREKSMKQLIGIDRRNIDGDAVSTVNARELHTFLGNRDHFATWIKDRIDQYGFVAGKDFTTYSGDSEKGRPRLEYAITIDMGKELSMVERTDKGKQARQYFIECEKHAVSAFNVPKTLSEALHLAADLARQVEDQVIQIEAAKPAVEFVERYVEANGAKNISDVAKVLGFKPQAFFQALADREIIFRRGNTWIPYQHHIDAGRFSVKTGEKHEHAFVHTKVEPKGIEWLAKMFAKAGANA